MDGHNGRPEGSTWPGTSAEGAGRPAEGGWGEGGWGERGWGGGPPEGPLWPPSGHPPGPRPDPRQAPQPGPQPTGPQPTGPQPAPWLAGRPTNAPGPETLGPNTRCYLHPDRLAGAVCRSCGNPICADCMVEAPVGWHCTRCVKHNARRSPVARYRPGTAGLPRVRQAPVTLTIIAVCVVLYLASTSDPTLLDQAAEWGIGIQQGQWWRLFTSIFFHVDILHITLDMVALLVIGRLIEPVIGPWRYTALFLLSGLGGSVAAYLLSSPQSAAVGASGAIFGLFGAYFVLARRAAADTTGILVLIAINLAFSFSVAGIAWQAHIGGLVTGVVVAAGLGLGRGRRRQVEIAADVAVIALACLALGLLMTLPPGVANLNL